MINETLKLGRQWATPTNVMWREARRIFQGIRRCQQNQPRDQLNRHNRLLLLSSFPYLFCLILYRLHIRTGRFWVISLLHVLYVYVAAVRAPRSASVIQRSCTASTSQLAKLIPYTVEGLLGVTMKIRKRERKKNGSFFLKTVKASESSFCITLPWVRCQNSLAGGNCFLPLSLSLFCSRESWTLETVYALLWDTVHNVCTTV